jgi:hypothetical protein
MAKEIEGAIFVIFLNLPTSNPLLLHLTLHSPSIRETTLTNHRLIVTNFPNKKLSCSTLRAFL